MEWSFGRVFSAIATAVDPGQAALIHGERTIDWGEFDRRTDSLAAAFLAAGAVAGDKLAHLMRNSPAYSETTVAGFKARLVHVNVNYRYTGEELFYILDNSDAAVVVYDSEFADVIATLRPRLPRLKLYLQVGGEPADFAQSYEAVAEAGSTLAPQDHRADDMLFIYTGGTTGMPKGVMWSQGDMWSLLGGGGPQGAAMPVATLDELFASIRSGIGVNRTLVMPPLMHGTGFLSAIYTLARGGCVITLPAPSFQPLEALAACARHRPTHGVLVGDAFARPLLRALDNGGGSIASLNTILSSGTMWSSEVKAGLLRHNPNMMLLDALSSSESLGMGSAIHTAANAGEPTVFVHDPNTLVLDENLVPVVPGSGAMGRIARAGLIPRGYYKDPVKSAATFVEIGDQRYSLAGDWATVDADGAIVLLGRGSQCINTAGEKVFPEEVEEALKTHAAVDDALVFGVADEKWGEAVTAIVSGADGTAPDTLIAHVRTRLAAYKTPKRVVIVSQIPRAANGKPDYARAKEMV